MNNHTPGPWVIIPGGDEWSSGRIATIEPKPETMVDTNYWTLAEVNYRRDEYLANAKLIAAAPELLIALRLALDALAHCAADKGYQSLQNKAAHAANSAIAKATQ